MSLMSIAINYNRLFCKQSYKEKENSHFNYTKIYKMEKERKMVKYLICYSIKCYIMYTRRDN